MADSFTITGRIIGCNFLWLREKDNYASFDWNLVSFVAHKRRGGGGGTEYTPSNSSSLRGVERRSHVLSWTMRCRGTFNLIVVDTIGTAFALK